MRTQSVEVSQSKQGTIEADRRAVDEPEKRLDDPESKVLSDRCEAITAELDGDRRVLRRPRQAHPRSVLDQGARMLRL